MRKGLDDLKTSLLFFTIGGILALIPVINLLGALLEFVALIFLIIGWRSLGKSNLTNARRYRSTGNWIVYSIIIAMVIGFLGTIAIIVGLISSLPVSGTPFDAQTFFQSQLFSNLLGQIFVLSGISLIGVIYAWYLGITSLRRLAEEVSEKRLRTSAWFLSGYVVTIFIGLGIISTAFFTGSITIPIFTAVGTPGVVGTSSFSAFSGPALIWVLGVELLESALLVAGSYLGYSGIKSVLKRGLTASPSALFTS